MPRRPARLGAGLAGDGLLVRLRSTAIAILGLVAAVGLALVAVVSQMGWPSVLSGPLPQAPETFARNAAIVAPASPPRGKGKTGHSRPNRAAAGPVARTPRPTSELTAANPVESPAPESPPPSHHPSTPKSQGHGQSSPAPAQTPEVAPTPSPEDEPASGEVAPPKGEAPSPPVATASEDSPGHSGESHGHHYGGGPPPWAGRGQEDSGTASDDDSWDHGHGDHGGGWDHH